MPQDATAIQGRCYTESSGGCFVRWREVVRDDSHTSGAPLNQPGRDAGGTGADGRTYMGRK